MNPMMIMALVSAAMPIFQELLALGEQIAQAVQATQGTPALSTLTALQAQHASLVANTVKSLATAVAAP
jgi:hypothetical protein